jgi:hypothetical protein
MEIEIMKTIQDYMNDPRIFNDLAMAKALEPIREIHAIRLTLRGAFMALECFGIEI